GPSGRSRPPAGPRRDGVAGGQAWGGQAWAGTPGAAECEGGPGGRAGRRAWSTGIGSAAQRQDAVDQFLAALHLGAELLVDPLRALDEGVLVGLVHRH